MVARGELAVLGKPGIDLLLIGAPRANFDRRSRWDQVRHPYMALTWNHAHSSPATRKNAIPRPHATKCISEPGMC